ARVRNRISRRDKTGTHLISSASDLRPADSPLVDCTAPLRPWPPPHRFSPRGFPDSPRGLSVRPLARAAHSPQRPAQAHALGDALHPPLLAQRPARVPVLRTPRN